MRQGRVLAVYIGLLLGFFVVLCRLYLLAQNTGYAARAERQTVSVLTLQAARGDLYDRTGRQLTGRRQTYRALCVPGERSYARLFEYVSPAAQGVLYRQRNSATPFLIEVDRDLTGQGVYTVAQPQRYAALPYAVHLIGYRDAEGRGLAGLEAALEETLASGGEPGYVQCVTNAQGSLMGSTAPTLHPGSAADALDVQLTLSAAVQRGCEGIAGEMMTTGCILVLDTNTAQVLASVSMPGYDPENVAKSIAAADSSLLNRALCAYSVGSVFKPVLAAAALENGLEELCIECKGYCRVGDRIYRCANGVPHGEVDLETALRRSCNCYFIALGAALGPEKLAEYAQRFGFGQAVYLTGGLKAAAGVLPDVDALRSAGERANFSFGQGQLTATPVQLAAMMNAIACGGTYRAPRFLLRSFRASTGETAEEFADGAERTILRPEAAATLRGMLAQVVQQGTGREAQPLHGTAAGKTGTAQTGRFAESGEELKNLWFAGYYPAEDPHYTIVVLQDDQTAAEHSSAAVFAQVCKLLYYLDGAPAEYEPEPAEEG